MTVRITDRAVDEAARLLSLDIKSARTVLEQWAPRVIANQAGNIGANGQRTYRGPKPWRLLIVVDRDDQAPGDAVVTVLPTADTNAWQKAYMAGRSTRPNIPH